MNKVYNFFMKYGGLMALVFSIIILAIFFININIGFGGIEGVDGSTDLAKLIHEKDAPELNFFNFGLTSAMVMAVIAALVWVIFGLLSLVLNFKNSIKSLISFGVVIVLFIVFYNTATVETTGRLGEIISDPIYNVSDLLSIKFFGIELFKLHPVNLISGGIKTTLSLFGLSILVLIVSEILSFFK